MRREILLALTPAIVAAAFTTTHAHADEASKPATIDYTVKKGDTCTTVSEKFFGPGKVARLHEANPQLGPSPHHLVEGSVLHIVTDAQVSFVRNRVEDFTPEEHAAHPSDPLMRGHRVDTDADSSAEVVFADRTRLQLGEHTLVVILGAASAAAKVSTAAETTLMRGTLRAHLAELAAPTQPPLTLATGSGHKVLVQSGSDVLLGEDETQTSRLAVHRGKSTLQASGKQVAVVEGFGSKAEKNKPPTPPRPLPDPPTWKTAMPRLVLAAKLPVDVTGTYAPGTGPGPAVATWHVQFARDERFNDVIVDAHVGAGIDKLEARSLPAGSYFARVSGIDDDAFEGKSSAVERVTVVAATETPTTGQRGSLTVPDSLFCGLDGAPLTQTKGGTLAVSLARTHHLRCALAADGANASETTIAPRSISVLHVAAELTKADPARRESRVTLKLTDADGAPVSGDTLVATASDGATVGSPVESATPGTYEAPVTWTEGHATFALSVKLNGLDSAASNLVHGTEPAAPPVVAAAPRSPYSGEIGILAGFAVTSDQLNLGPAIAVEAGGRRSFGAFSVAAGLRARFEHYGYDAQGTCTSPATPLAAPCLGTTLTGYGYRVDDDVLTFEVPLSIRLGNPQSVILPYAGIAPGVAADHHSITANGSDQTFANQGTAGRFTFHAFLGTQLQFGSGGVFVEYGYRLSPVEQLPEGPSHLASFLWSVGYRLTL